MMLRLIAMLYDLFSISMPPERYRVWRDEVRPKQFEAGDCARPAILILPAPILAILTGKRHDASRLLSNIKHFLPRSPSLISRRAATKQCLVFGCVGFDEDFGHALAQNGILPSS